MPVSLDVELEIVATLTKDAACALYQREGLRRYHFADMRCAMIYDWCMMYFAGYGAMRNAPSVEVVCTEFPDYPDVISQVKGAAPSYLCDKLKQDYIRRQVQDVLRDSVQKIPIDPPAATLELRNKLSAVIDSCAPANQCIEYGSDMDSYRKMLLERQNRSGAPYPFPEMQGWTGGIKPGEMAVLVGSSGLGKTNLACKTALEAIRNGWNVYYATLELEPLNVTERIEYMVVNEDGLQVPICEYVQGVRPPAYVEAIHAAQDKIAQMPGRLFVDQPELDDRTPTALVQNCKAHDCNFLIIDQLQFVLKPQRDSLSESVGAAMQEFKQQLLSPADNVRLPMLLLHQMNRVGTKAQLEGTGHIGTMSDIAHSSWVEQLSDVVWGIGRNREEANVGVMNLATLKTRNFGPVGWRLSWDTDLMFNFEVQKDEAGNPTRLEEW